MKVCPSCGRAWIPLGEEPVEYPACRHAIGMCALVGGQIRVEAERRELAKVHEYARRLERRLTKGEPWAEMERLREIKHAAVLAFSQAAKETEQAEAKLKAVVEAAGKLADKWQNHVADESDGTEPRWTPEVHDLLAALAAAKEHTE